MTAPAPHRAPAGARDFRGISAGQSDLLHLHQRNTGGEGVAIGNCDFGGVCYAPPDVNVAAGTSEVIETVNCTIAGFSKTDGSQLWIADLRTLFPAGVGSSCTDPRVIFIPWIGRFAVEYWDNTNSDGPIRFAVSKTPNPGASASDWYSYASPSAFLDQPKIVATANTLVLSAENYPIGAEQYYVYDLNQVASGTSGLSMTALTGNYLPAWGAVGEGYPAPPNAYFVSTNGDGIHLSVISGDPVNGNVAISYQTVSTLPITSASDPAVPGGFMSGGGNRVISAVYEVQNSNSHPVIDFSGDTECGQKTCPYDIKLDLSTTPAQIVKELNLTSSRQDYTFGAVALDQAGNAFMAYSASDASDTPSADALADTDNGTGGWNTVIHPNVAGTTACDGSTGCTERWGDYFGAAQDPSNTSDVWLAAEWQAGNGLFGWGTSLVEVNSSGVVVH